MRYLYSKNISIDTQNQLLFRDEQAIALEPKVYALLLFFCRNSERLISKDELMAQVWAGTLVNDNTISRTLVKVRKALGDDSKSPHFIVTIPRKGYQMQARFLSSAQLSQNEEKDLIETQNTGGSSLRLLKIPSRKLVVFSGFILFILFIISLFKLNDLPKFSTLKAKEISPLTRSTGVEWFPAMSFDMGELAYVQVDVLSGFKYIKIENQHDKNSKVIKHADANISKPVWSPKGETLAFLYQTASECKIVSAPFYNIQNSTTWTTLAKCNQESSPIYQFSSDGKFLYYNNKQSVTAGYQIFRVDLNNYTQELIQQPNNIGLGNYQFNVSPDGKKLVILNSEYAPKTRIYTLELTKSHLTATGELNYLMRSVVWHHDNESLIHPSPHPAYQLWQSNIAGKKLAIVASSPTRVTHLKRMPNGKDFLFSAYLINRDIYRKSLELTQKSHTDITLLKGNSSVMDYLPALAKDNKSYAFVSKRSNKAEVYLGNFNKQNTVKISQFNNAIKLYQLSFSPNDQQLLIVANNEIYIYDFKLEKMTELSIKNKGIRGVTWGNEQSLLLSVINNSTWQVMRYDLSQDLLTRLDENLKAGLFANSNQSYYFFEKEKSQIMVQSHLDGLFEKTELFCSPTFINRKLNLIATEQGLICQSKPGDKYLTYYDFTTKTVIKKKHLDNFSDFDINSDNVIYAQSTQNVGDIMRTITP
ncbi:winged helix-turn-helix domain-containing protein [Pseudoalteromonas denitrificans]|uniref:DNA-binding winged helix-turn-helix (WHTH) domain-containing protein n=1 Tax=Pseudoalteromonas denitrificans DSM 6059 TaxID=1123010 RepID=A0A1I1IF89_9GAMM|nr:winged helix-turn-helix domain-containing protein [Pseudoalteromonas denitrificans]SFC32928.1 DNA-binding winged helix-turn-helix (wHTH) domain-containing protein [Pseudoalteromonas denitrificans DSM 6059]